MVSDKFLTDSNKFLMDSEMKYLLARLDKPVRTPHCTPFATPISLASRTRGPALAQMTSRYPMQKLDSTLKTIGIARLSPFAAAIAPIRAVNTTARKVSCHLRCLMR